MEFSKNKFLDLIKWRYFPIVILSTGMILIHASLKLGWGDDKIMFFEALNDDRSNMITFLINRYNGWSSRIIIESLLIIMVHVEPIWRLLDTAIIVLCAVSISKLVPSQNASRTNWLIVCILFMYPFIHMSSAGWIATTINYLWPLALGLFSMIPIKKVLFYEKISWYEYLLYFPALIFAANQEQMCAILFVVYFMFTMYLVLNKRINVYMVIQTIICLMSIIFILTTPGNTKRTTIEIQKWFPDYINISFIRKIEMGFSSSWFEFIMKPNTIFTVFCILLFLCMMVTQKKNWYKWIACIPLASCLFFGLFINVLGVAFPAFQRIINFMTEYGTGVNFSSIISWIPDIILAIVFISILISLFFTFSNIKYAILTIFIILLGFGSRMIMSFSPTIWASAERTFIFMYFAFIISSVLLYQVILSSKISKYDIFIKSIVSGLALLTFLTTLYSLG